MRTSNSAYRDVWSRIESHFFNESRNSLITRLEYYKTFLENLLTILEEGLALLAQASVPISDKCAGNHSIGMYTTIISYESTPS